MVGGRYSRSGGLLGGAGTIALVSTLAACGGHGGADSAPAAGPTTAPRPAPTTPVSTTPVSTAASPTSTGTGGSGAACVNTDVSAAVRAALLRADGRPAATEVAGRLYYAVCGATAYAVDTFEASPAATSVEGVAFQDHGAYPEFFVRHGTTAWTRVGSAPGPPGPPSCATFTRAPAAVRSLWNDCVPPGTTPTTTTTTATGPGSTSPTTVGTASCATFAMRHFERITTVAVAGDGSATLGGTAETVSCGGPDDYHFVPGASEDVHLVAGGSIEVVPSPPTGPDRSLPLDRLGHYVAGIPESGIFEITGTPAHATGVTEVYRP